MQETLYIELDENGQPVNHPLLEINLIHLYGSIENIPKKYEIFNRIPQNVSYTKLQRLVHGYEYANGVWRDCWSVEDLTGDELLNAKQSALSQSLSELPGLLELSRRILQRATDENKREVSAAYVGILENLELTLDNPFLPEPPIFDDTLGKWTLK